MDTVPVCESCGAHLNRHPAFLRAARRLGVFFNRLNVTFIGSERSMPQGTKIWFIFDDDYKALVAAVQAEKGD